MYIYVHMSSHPVLNTDHTDTLHQKGKNSSRLIKNFDRNVHMEYGH